MDAELISAFINRHADAVEKIQIVSAANFHAFMISDCDEMHPFQPSNAGRRRYHFPW